MVTGKRKRSNAVEEKETESSSQSDSELSDEDEQTDDQHLFKTVLDKLSKTVSEHDASELLHSMAASRGILFWTDKGEMLYHERRLPVTSMSDLVEYFLLPYNKDIPRPRALNTFLDGIAEIGINKRLIHNKKLLAEVVQREQENESQSETDTDIESSNDSSHEESESDVDNDDEEGKDSDPSEGSEENQPEEYDSNVDNSDNDEAQKVTSCKNCGSHDTCTFLVLTCPKCRWSDARFMTHPGQDWTSQCEICLLRFALTSAPSERLFKNATSVGLSGIIVAKPADRNGFILMSMKVTLSCQTDQHVIGNWQETRTNCCM